MSVTEPHHAWVTVDTPLGETLLVASLGGLVRVGLPGTDHGAYIAQYGAVHDPQLTNAHVANAAAQLAEYFTGARRAFTLELDRPSPASFRARACAALDDIAYGHTRTYSDIAQQLGNPRAVRAVGSACATNQLPIVVPCHRVVRSDGTLGGYAGGTEMKQYLLQWEQARHDRG